MPNFYTAKDGKLFVQPYGPNTDPDYLGCHDISDIVIPRGSVERRWCPDPETGDYVLGNRVQGPPDAPTATLTTHIAETADYLERLNMRRCPQSFYVLKGKCKSRKLVLNYGRGWVLHYGIETQKTLSGLAAGFTSGIDESGQAFEYDLAKVEPFFQLQDTRETTTETQTLFDIAACNAPQCAGVCGPAEEACDFLVAVAAAETGVATANVIYSLDGGITWTAMATDPFLADEDVISVVCFPVGDGSATRVVVARGTTSGLVAEIAWTDDLGATAWNNVLVGTTATEFAQWNGALFALDRRHIWLVTDSGNIYFSNDGALSWTEQATTNTNGLNYVRFVDEQVGLAVGDTNTILLTRDGGGHWNALTGPVAQAAVNCQCVDLFDDHRYFIGYSDGELWYTLAGDVNMVSADWSQRLLDTPTGAVSTHRINDVMFYRDGGYHTDDHMGYLVTKWEDGSGDYHGAIYRTYDGGFDWEIWYTAALDAPATYGLAAVWNCGYNKAFAVGDPLTTAYILSLAP